MIFEEIFDLYVNIAEKFSASGKLKKWQESLLRVLCAIMLLAMLTLIPFGICLLTAEEASHALGIAMLAVGVSVLIVHIALVLCLAGKRKIAEKRDIEEDAAETFTSDDPEPLVRTLEETESGAEKNLELFCHPNSRESK